MGLARQFAGRAESAALHRLDTGQVQSVQGKPANVIMRMSSPRSAWEPLPDGDFSFVPADGARQADELPRSLFFI